jgi:hypothetical protein
MDAGWTKDEVKVTFTAPPYPPPRQTVLKAWGPEIIENAAPEAAELSRILDEVCVAKPNPGFHYSIGQTCGDTKGELQYTSWRYMGGPPPGPEMIVGRYTWKYKGVVLGDSIHYGDGKFKLSDLQETFEKGTQIPVDLSKSGAKPYGFEIQAQKITLVRKDGQPLFPGQEVKSVTDWFLCRENFVNVPMP